MAEEKILALREWFNGPPPEEEDDDARAGLERMLVRAKAMASHNLILPLVYYVQNVERDPANDCRPTKGNNPAAVAAADAAVALLVDACSLVNVYLEDAGWEAAHPGQTAGSMVYKNQTSGLQTENPDLPDDSWELQLLFQIPRIITGTSLPDEPKACAYTAKVVHLSPEALEIRIPVDLTAPPPIDAARMVAVIDVIERDEYDEEEQGPVTKTMRGLIHGPWRGLFHEPLGKFDPCEPPGRDLHEWSSVTMGGMALLATRGRSGQPRVLLLGVGAGLLVSFLQYYIPGVVIDAVEPLAAVAQCAGAYFGLNAPPGGSITLHSESVQAFLQASTDTYDCILVDLCGSGPHRFPPVLQTDSFYAQLSKRLNTENPEALVLVDLRQDTLPIADGLRRVFGAEHVATFCEPEHLVAEDADPCVVLCVQPGARPADLTIDQWAVCAGVDACGSMDVADAMRTKVHRIPQLLSLEEIAEVHALAQRARGGDRPVGREVRRMPEKGAQAAEDGAEFPWYVLHLHSDGFAAREMQPLLAKLEAAIRRADEAEGWGLLKDHAPLNVRVVEYHHMSSHGTLENPHHYDQDSLITIDVMLTDPATDFEGGTFQTMTVDGQLEAHTFLQGDASVFVSHKAHCVSEVTAGRRHVLVVEFWRGKARECPHRCLVPFGRCLLDPADSSTADRRDSAGRRALPFAVASICKSGGVKGGLEVLWQAVDAGAEVEVPPRAAPPAAPAQSAAKSNDDLWALFD